MFTLQPEPLSLKTISTVLCNKHLRGSDTLHNYAYLHTDTRAYYFTGVGLKETLHNH